MIVIKNKMALAKMREAGSRLARVMHEVAELIQPGVTAAWLDAEVESRMHKLGLVPACKGFMGYKHATCISLNEIVVHGVPSANAVLKSGDCVAVDMVGIYQGYHADMARTFIVPGDTKPAAEVVRLIEVAQASLEAAKAVMKPGVRLRTVSRHIQKVVEEAGFGIVRDFVGHGIGRQMHEDPQVPNYDAGEEGPILRAGMTLAVEPMITIGSAEVEVLSDGWSVQTRDGSWAAHVEDTIAITETGIETLTQVR